MVTRPASGTKVLSQSDARDRKNPVATAIQTSAHMRHDARESAVIVTQIEKRLAELGLVLPEPARPVADYVPFVRTGDLVFVSGQISIGPDGLIKGRLGETMSIEDGARAARACAINILSQLKKACGGDLGRVRRIVKLGGFVNCTADFFDHPKVIDGASSLVREVFGDAGRHARAAVGAPSLPMGAAVEVDAIAEIG